MIIIAGLCDANDGINEALYNYINAKEEVTCTMLLVTLNR